MTVEIIDRERWGARHGRGHAMAAGPKGHVIVHHDGHNRSRAGMSIDEESAIMRIFEDFHAKGLTKANPRIAYSWVVMQTGRIYEGLGWGRIGAHTAGLNSKGYAWCFPIHGGQTKPTAEAIEAFRWHVAEGIRLGHLSPSAKVTGHQDHGKPTCPGALLYQAAVTNYRPFTAPAARPVRQPPRIVYSEYFDDYLIVTDYRSDADWRFVPFKQLPPGVRAQTPLSQMPKGPVAG